MSFLFLDEKVSLDVGKLIQKGRMEKKLTQKELATVSLNNNFAIFLNLRFSSKEASLILQALIKCAAFAHKIFSLENRIRTSSWRCVISSLYF